jgi:hypothetical protein
MKMNGGENIKKANKTNINPQIKRRQIQPPSAIFLLGIKLAKKRTHWVY